MRPTYNELTQINPRLCNRTPKELEDLIDAIEECGYSWDSIKKIFNNSQLGRGIRTEGLDMFSPDEIKETHIEIKNDIIKYPDVERAKKLWALWVLKLIGFIILWGMFSWIIFGWHVWIFGLLVLVVVLVAFYYYCSARWVKCNASH